MASKKNDNNWIRTFEVTQPSRHVKGFTVYKVTSKVFMKSLPEGVTTLTVWKRYNDFKKLYTQLEMIHRQLYLQGKVPTFPKGRVFGRFEYEVVEERRKAALILLQFAAVHPQLFTSKVFNKFFEEGYNVKDLSTVDNVVEEDSITAAVGQGDDSRVERANKPAYSNTCLIPERLWTKPPPNQSADCGDFDGLSNTSEESTSAETAILTDSDSILSGSIFSSVSQVSTNKPKLASVQSATCNPSFALTEYNLTLLDLPLSSLSAELPPVPVADSSEENRIASAPVLPNSSSMSTLGGGAAQIEIALMCEQKADQPLLSSQSCSNLSVVSKSSTTKQKSMLGFFDFLPSFHKKDEISTRQESEDQLLSDSLSASYICEAAGHFVVAKEYESNELFSEAFSSYKEGIRILLVGAKTDDDPKRKGLVRKKLDKYLSRAEALNMDFQIPNTTYQPSSEAGNSPRNLSTSPSPRKVDLVSDSKLVNNNMKSSPIEELKNYKIVRIIQRQVYTVVEMTKDRPRCYAMKVLNVSTCPVEPEKSTIIPSDVPFMVKLLKWFTTGDSYILLMQYAAGGRLKNFVESYQTKPIVITPVEPDQEEYEGKVTSSKPSALDPKSENTKVLSVLSALSELNQNCEDEQENCESYTRLFREYSESTKGTGCVLAREKIPSVRVPLGEPSQNRVETEPSQRSSLANQNHIPEVEEIPVKITSGEIEAESCISWNQLDNINTEDLIESSRALIQTVNETLENVKQYNSVETPPRQSSSESDPIPGGKIQDKVRFGDTEKSGGNAVQGSETKDNFSHTNSQLLISEKGSKGGIRRMPSLTVPSSTYSSGDFLSRSMEDLKILSADPSPISVSCFNTMEEGGSTSNQRCEGNVEIVAQDSISISNTIPASVEELSVQRLVPECCIKVWAAEMVMCLEHLHRLGLAYGDLEMKNVLLGESGHILLSFTSQWSQVDQNLYPAKNSYSAPELCHSVGQPMWKIHPSCDFWSLGAILFELLTGQSVQSVHPEGFYPQTLLRIPRTNILGELISRDAKSLLVELLQYTPSLRLGYYGAEEIKNHPFFEGIDWERALAAAMASTDSPTA